MSLINPSSTSLSGEGGAGTNNVFKIPTGEQYTVEENQELINSGLFHLDGEMVLDGKWSLLGETSALNRTGDFGIEVGDHSSHSHSSVEELSILSPILIGGVYQQSIQHNLNAFPMLKILNDNGVEIHPLVKHTSLNTIKIESTQPLSGKVYVLHSTATSNPLLFGSLELTSSAEGYSQLITHNSGSFPFFTIVDDQGVEVKFKITHLTENLTKIESNVLLSGSIYML